MFPRSGGLPDYNYCPANFQKCLIMGVVHGQVIYVYVEQLPAGNYVLIYVRYEDGFVFL